MSFQSVGRFGPVFETCRYGASKLAFRGPKRSLKNEYVAFLGGTETYGKYVEHPYPQRVEAATGLSCVNLGWPNAGIDVMLNDPGFARIASGARLTVLQVPCAANLSNSFYKVHPRRNDRFLKARDPLKKFYPTVDFTEFHFTRHMLARLRDLSCGPFLEVQAELAALWVTGMKRLICNIESPVLLLWFSDRSPDQHCDDPDLRYEPALVSRNMLDAVEKDVAGLVEFNMGGAMRSMDPDFELAEKVLSRFDRQLMRDVPGQMAHDSAAEALIPAMAGLLDP
ncbi:MAG: DUF6473 family protein [Pseudomonadota bacterium]